MEKQLTLFGQFDRTKKRQEKLHSDLSSKLKTLKMIIGHTNAHNAQYDMDSNSPAFFATNSARKSLDYAAYYLTTLMYGVTRELDAHKSKTVGDFNDMGVFDPYNMPSDPMTPGELYITIKNINNRLEALLEPYREELEQNKVTSTSYKFLLSSINAAQDAVKLTEKHGK